jgi:4'-phosphopantetheinyl transferase
MSDLGFWLKSPAKLELAENEIHVWRAHLDCGGTVLRKFEATLSSDEKDRANRFHFERDRNSFTAARGILRDLLGRYIAQDPGKIEFEYSPLGKPTLRAAPLDGPIRFNVSHSHGMALFAFASGRNVGVDIEQLRPDFGGDEIAQRYFAPQEVEELRALPVTLRPEGFFLCWTRKEAYVKARGEGLHIPLDSFHVSLTPGQPERLHTADALLWTLRSLRPDSNYVGALVGEGRGWHLKSWDWNPEETK